jgi:hypothetical protein
MSGRINIGLLDVGAMRQAGIFVVFFNSPKKMINFSTLKLPINFKDIEFLMNILSDKTTGKAAEGKFKKANQIRADRIGATFPRQEKKK